MAQGKSSARRGDPVVVVDGVRTPFCRQLGELAGWNGIDLGAAVVSELIDRTGLDPALIERVVYGQVILTPEAPNTAREVSLAAGVPPSSDAVTVSRACTTSLQATIDVARALLCNEIEIGIAGGGDSTSVLPIQTSRTLADALLRVSRARSLRQKLAALRPVRPRHLLPQPPAIKDYSTELKMGDIAEQMARDHGITREAQDVFAVESHRKAAAAWDAGRLDDEVAGCAPPPEFEWVHRDPPVRSDSEIEGVAQLKPAFDRRYGTVTAGNSPPLTDGASALLLMRESRARAEGMTPLGVIRSWALTGNNPFHDGLMGPSFATPLALERAGLSLPEIDLVEFHEAFAAQALANLETWKSAERMERVTGRGETIGEVDPARLNVNGGSLAFGHPFSATGGRMMVQILRELRRRDANTGLLTACAAGGLGVAMVVEAV